MPQPYNIFTIYAREDTKLLSELLSQLKPLEISGRIKVWSDREINPGVQWEQEIVRHLDTADIILILVSPAYYNSEYIHRVEIKRAVERHQRSEAKVLPIIVRPCSFEDDPVVSSLQLLPTDGKAVTDDEHWRSQDKAWLDVVNGVKRTLAGLSTAEAQKEQEIRDAEARREQATLATEQKREKEKRQKKPAAPLPWGRYAAICGGVFALLLTMWFLPKIYGEKDGQTAQDQSIQPDTTQLSKSWVASKDSTPPTPVEELKQDTVSPKPKFKDPFEGQMVYVEGGTFTMGSSIILRNRSDSVHNIDCQHDVTLPSFNIGKYEVTQAQWRLIMGSNPSKFKGCDNCPVERVSWYDVQEYIKTLNKATNKRYRLPTEAEWEYAAKGGKKSQGYEYIGGNDLGSVAWYSRNSGSKTHPVGTKKPNELDLYDMAGNVMEWCKDILKNYPCDIKWQENGEHCIRGGSWSLQFPPEFTPWFHSGSRSTLRGANYGFRLAHD